MYFPTVTDSNFCTQSSFIIEAKFYTICIPVRAFDYIVKI